MLLLLSGTAGVGGCVAAGSIATSALSYPSRLFTSTRSTGGDTASDDWGEVAPTAGPTPDRTTAGVFTSDGSTNGVLSSIGIDDDIDDDVGAAGLDSSSVTFASSSVLCSCVCIRRNCSISFWNRLGFASDFSFSVGNKLATLPHDGQQNSTDLAARRFRSAELQSKAPIAPSAGDGRKAIRASKIRRMPQAGCHNSGWKAEKDRQIFVCVSKRPDGVKKTM